MVRSWLVLVVLLVGAASALPGLGSVPDGPPEASPEAPGPSSWPTPSRLLPWLDQPTSLPVPPPAPPAPPSTPVAPAPESLFPQPPAPVPESLPAPPLPVQPPPVPPQESGAPPVPPAPDLPSPPPGFAPDVVLRQGDFLGEFQVTRDGLYARLDGRITNVGTDTWSWMPSCGNPNGLRTYVTDGQGQTYEWRSYFLACCLKPPEAQSLPPGGSVAVWDFYRPQDTMGPPLTWVVEIPWNRGTEPAPGNDQLYPEGEWPSEPRHPSFEIPFT